MTSRTPNFSSRGNALVLADTHPHTMSAQPMTSRFITTWPDRTFGCYAAPRVGQTGW
jgi:hypothetical protein